MPLGKVEEGTSVSGIDSKTEFVAWTIEIEDDDSTPSNSVDGSRTGAEREASVGEVVLVSTDTVGADGIVSKNLVSRKMCGPTSRSHIPRNVVSGCCSASGTYFVRADWSHL